MAFGGTGSGFAFGGGGGAGGQAGGGGLFGSNPQPPAAGGGLFGGQQPGGQATGSLFGGGGAAQPAKPAGGLFGGGGAVAAPSSGGGLFGGGGGAGAQTASGLFGGSSAVAGGAGGGGGGFGTAGGATGGGLFGGGAPAGGGLFGAPATGQTGSSLFGGGGGFGSTPGQTGSLFGSTPAGATGQTGTSLFGASSQPSLFGGGQQNTGMFGANPATGGSLFGSGSKGGFGTTAGGSLFGGAKWGTPAQGGAAGGGGGLFGGQSLTTTTAPSGYQLPLGLQSIFDAFDPNGPYCRFRHMLYNVVDPRDVDRFQRPPGTDERLWEQARQNNPDPSRLVPVQVSSFEQLNARVDQQNARISAHLSVLSSLEQAVSKLREEHKLSSAVKFADYRRRHNELVQRLYTLISKLEQVLNRGQHLSQDDMDLRHGLEAVSRQLTKPTPLSDKLADVVEAAKLSAKKRHRPDRQIGDVDTRAMRMIQSLLTDQYRGISFLFTEHKTCHQHLEILVQALPDPTRRR